MKVLTAMVLAALLAPAIVVQATAGQREGLRPLAGRPLAAVLRDLQRRGLNIVFSSELVRPEIRVESEPVATDGRPLLDELLRPHGLEALAGPRGLLLVVRAAARPGVPQERRALATIRGAIVDARSAAPLPGALVRLTGAGDGVVSDQSGRFELTAVRAGKQSLVVSLVGYSLARPDIEVPSDGVLELTVALSGGTGTYSEEITVSADRFRGSAASVPAAMTLGSADLLELRGVLSDDPFRAVQSLPAVMTGNDYRSEFSVRGSDFRHVGLTIDGLAMGWPVHTVREDLSGGSVALINGDVVDAMTLVTGAYPEDRPARTGAWVDISIREGSRVATQVHGAVSMTSASLVLEGPAGAAGGTARGSWLVSARQSYLQWLLKRINPQGGTTFGFSDVQGKFVFDLTPRHQIRATFASGHSLLDQYQPDAGANLVGRGSSRVDLAVVGWRATAGTSTVMTHQIGTSDYRFSNAAASGLSLADGSGTEVSYNGEVAVAIRPTTTIRAGGTLRRQSADQHSIRFLDTGTTGELASRVEAIAGSQALASAHARLSHTFPRGIALDGGVLVTRGLGSRISPWLTAIVPVGRLTVRAGAGIYRQHPGLDQTIGTFAGTDIRPERSRQVDLALEYGWRPETRVQITFYDRREREMLRLEGDEYRLVDGIVVPPSTSPVWMNALEGTSHGFELLLQRRSAAGLSGWLAYGFSRTSYADQHTGERFAADYDQRHTLSAYAQFRISPVTSVSARLRLGSNFPIPGYLEDHGGELFIAAERNRTRLPAYARLDVRANRAFNFDTRRLTLFVEIVNLLGRRNLTTDAFRVLPSGRAIATTQRLFPFLPTVGLSFDF